MKKLLALSFLMALSAMAFAGQPSFSGIEEGDRIEVTHSSKGCFHGWTRYFEVSRRDGSCFFTEYAITWSPAKPGEMTDKKVIGEAKLSQKDLEGLDGLMGYYRGKKEGGSTTFESLVIEYFEGGNRIKVENLEDGSGGLALEKRTDVITFYELIRRLQSPGR